MTVLRMNTETLDTAYRLNMKHTEKDSREQDTSQLSLPRSYEWSMR